MKLWSAEGYEEEWIREGGPSDDGLDDDDDSEDGQMGRRSPTYRRRTPEEGITEAWQKMEEGLIGLDQPLAKYASPISGPLGRDDPANRPQPSEKTRDYEFPTLPLSHGLFSLSVQAREEVDIWAEDVESILSSALAGDDLQSRKEDSEAVDMGQLDLEEEYFTPTLTARRKASTSNTPVAELNLMGDRASSPRVGLPLDRAYPGETGVAAGNTMHETSTAVATKPQRPRRVISESQVGSGAGIGLDARPGAQGGQSVSPAESGKIGGLAAVVGDFPFARPGLRQGVPVPVASGPSSFGERSRTVGGPSQVRVLVKYIGSYFR